MHVLDSYWNPSLISIRHGVRVGRSCWLHACMHAAIPSAYGKPSTLWILYLPLYGFCTCQFEARIMIPGTHTFSYLNNAGAQACYERSADAHAPFAESGQRHMPMHVTAQVVVARSNCHRW